MQFAFNAAPKAKAPLRTRCPVIVISYDDYYKIPYKQLNGIYEIENDVIYYWVNGKLHREDGPAEEYLDGSMVAC